MWAVPIRWKRWVLLKLRYRHVQQEFTAAAPYTAVKYLARLSELFPSTETAIAPSTVAGVTLGRFDGVNQLEHLLSNLGIVVR